MIQANNDTVKAFNFVTRAKEKFAGNDLKVRRDIFMGLGLHLKLQNKTVLFDSPKYIMTLKKMKEEAPVIAERVAPEKEVVMKPQMEQKFASIPAVLRGQELRLAYEIMQLLSSIT